MKIQRIFNDTSTHSLDDLSSLLADLLITEFIAEITQLVNVDADNKEVTA